MGLFLTNYRVGGHAARLEQLIAEAFLKRFRNQPGDDKHAQGGDDDCQQNIGEDQLGAQTGDARLVQHGLSQPLPAPLQCGSQSPASIQHAFSKLARGLWPKGQRGTLPIRARRLTAPDPRSPRPGPGRSRPGPCFLAGGAGFSGRFSCAARPTRRPRMPAKNAGPLQPVLQRTWPHLRPG